MSCWNVTPALICIYICSGAWETASTAVGGCEASVARLPQADGGPAAAGEDLPGSVPELPDGGSTGHKTKLRRPVSDWDWDKTSPSHEDE